MDNATGYESNSYRRELAFLQERLTSVEAKIESHCRNLTDEYPQVRDAILEECSSPYSDQVQASGLPRGADAAMIRFKREKELLQWLRDSLGEVPLSEILGLWQLETNKRLENLKRNEPFRGTYCPECWELRCIVENLKLLGQLWAEESRSAEEVDHA